jgi:hypothetical protein
MASRTHRLRTLIELQGFMNLSDQTLWDLDYWLRLSPFLCGVWVGVGVALGSPAILWALAPLALLGAILPNHPFDAVYNLGVRHLLATPPIPPYPAPRRFGSALATVWLLAMGWSFHAGLRSTGLALAIVMMAPQSVQVLTGFCLPAFVYRQLTKTRVGPYSSAWARK